MKISSNNDLRLEELYKSLKRDREEVELEKIPVENAMGFEIKLEINFDFNRLIEFLTNTFIDNKREKLYIRMLEDSKWSYIELEKAKENIKFIEALKNKNAELYLKDTTKEEK